jgi:hypothetical protein
MLVQRCGLDQHRLIIPVSVSKPVFRDGSFVGLPSHAIHRALVDTGAQRTVVSRSVIAQHGLVRTGHMEFSGLHGPRTHTRYLASIGLWARRIEPNDSSENFGRCEQTLFLLEEPVEIVNMDDNVNFELILGFDVLKLFTFAFDQRTRIFEIVLKS